jgi:hypothetical protein
MARVHTRCVGMPSRTLRVPFTNLAEDGSNLAVLCDMIEIAAEQAV